MNKQSLPSRELTYPPKMAFWVDDFPFPQVGYVNSLEGILGDAFNLQNLEVFNTRRGFIMTQTASKTKVKWVKIPPPPANPSSFRDNPSLKMRWIFSKRRGLVHFSFKKKKWDGGSVRNRKISTRKCVNWIVWEIILDHFDHDVWLEVHWHFIEFFAQQSPDFCTSKKTSRCFLHTPGYGSIFLPTLIPLWLEWLVCVCVSWCCNWVCLLFLGDSHHIETGNFRYFLVEYCGGFRGMS